MPMQVLNPGYDNRGSFFDDILKGLSVARDLYGMKVNMDDAKAKRDMLSKYGGMSPYEAKKLSLDEAESASKIEGDKVDQQYKKAQIAALANKGPGGKLTVGQESLDRKFAEEYNDFISRGGYADVQKGLNQLREVSSNLESQNLTGPVIGNTPDFVRSFTNPDSLAAQDAVNEVVQRNLRLILGAQFTEKEGRMLMERGYNPKLSEQENSKRIDRLITSIERSAKAKMDAAKYFEQNGTLTGYRGTLINSVDDILKMAEANPTRSAEPRTLNLPGEAKAKADEGFNPEAYAQKLQNRRR